MTNQELTLLNNVLIPTAVLAQYRSEVQAVYACKTIADLRRISPYLGVIGIPGASLEEMEDDGGYVHPETKVWTELAEDGPWDAVKVDSDDYVWPPALETISMKHLDSELVTALLESGAGRHTEVGGPLDWFVIPEKQTSNAIAIARARGFTVLCEPPETTCDSTGV